MPIGDISSDKKGTGARFNDGKARLDLIPLSLLASQVSGYGSWAAQALADVGRFQTDCTNTGALYEAYESLGDLAGALRDEAAVFEYGAKKYAAWNWAKGMNWSVPIGCFARHALAVIGGEENDPESGLPHRGHMACNLRMLMLFVETHPEGNDLPPVGLLGRDD